MHDRNHWGTLTGRRRDTLHRTGPDVTDREHAGRARCEILWRQAINPKLIKQFIEINPAILQQQQVVELIARYKKKKSRWSMG